VRFPRGGLNTGGDGGSAVTSQGGGGATPPLGGDRPGLLLAASGALLVALGGLALATLRRRSGAPRRGAAAVLVATCLVAGLAIGGCGGSTAGPLDAGRPHPVKIDIDSLGIHAPIVGVGLDQGYQVAIPPFDKPKETAWYQNSAVPGETGSAMITGHVDTNAGPAVFKNLSRIKPGDTLKVTLSNGAQVGFQVSETATYPKADFPAERVYGQSSFPALNLVTCAGAYDRAAGTYQDNFVAYSKMAG
jgi:LPXTG-site transpeptidase (sortase) family protein